MNARVGALRVDLSLNTAQFQDGLRRSTQQLEQSQTRFAAIGRSMQSVFAPLTALVAGGAITGAARSVLEFADNLDAAATQAGVSVERYQTLREAFRTLEIDARSTDRIFRQLQTTLGDVQNGADNAATAALDRLGITSRILNGEISTSDQLLDALAASATTAGSAAQFTSEIVDIFGQRVGPQLAAAIRDGGTALHGLEQQMIATGTVIDEEMVQRLAEANETLDRFFESTQRQAVIWAGTLIESIEGVGTSLYNFSIETPQWIDNIMSAFSRFGRTSVPILNLLPLDSIGEEIARTNAPPRAGIGGIEYALGGGARRPPRPARATRSGGGGRAQRSGGGGRGRSAEPRATRVEPDDFMSPWALGPTFAQMEEDARQLNQQLVDTPAIFDRITSSIPDVTRLMRIQEAEMQMEDFTADLSRGLADAIVTGRNLGDVLVQTFQRAAAALVESSIYDLLMGGRRGGGGVGGALGFIATIFGGSTGISGGTFRPQKVPGFATGGSFTVAGVPGIDRNMLSLNGVPVARVSRGETVDVGRGGRGSRVEIVPSPYFDVVVDGRVVKTGAPMVAAGMGDARVGAQVDMARRASRRIP